MKVVGAKSSTALSTIMSDTDATDAWYALIAPKVAAFISCNEDLNTVIGFAPNSSARIYSVKYNANGILVDYRVEYVNQENYYLYGNSGDGYIYKLMLLDHEDGDVKPLCEAVTVER